LNTALSNFPVYRFVLMIEALRRLAGHRDFRDVRDDARRRKLIQPMPIIAFRPTKSRLIIQDTKSSVLVMKVVVYRGDSVKLATGDTLEELTGVLRIRERRDGEESNGANDLGSLVYIPQSDDAADPTSAGFQINVAMAGAKFDMLVRVALSGRLPNKFFLETSERASRNGKPGFGYEVRHGKRTKFWDTHAHRALPVKNFTFILPIDVKESTESELLTAADNPGTPATTNVHFAELIDELLVFHGETKNTFLSLMFIVGIIAVAALVVGLALLKRT
jgi:hypothetical protein